MLFNVTDEYKFMPGIYIIKNNANARVYIGKTISLYERYKQHYLALKSGICDNKLLQEDFSSLGENAFTFHCIESPHPLNLSEREAFYIDLLNSLITGYNRQVGNYQLCAWQKAPFDFCIGTMTEQSISLKKVKDRFKDYRPVLFTSENLPNGILRVCQFKPISGKEAFQKYLVDDAQYIYNKQCEEFNHAVKSGVELKQMPKQKVLIKQADCYLTGRLEDYEKRLPEFSHEAQDIYLSECKRLRDKMIEDTGNYDNEVIWQQAQIFALKNIA